MQNWTGKSTRSVRVATTIGLLLAAQGIAAMGQTPRPAVPAPAPAKPATPAAPVKGAPLPPGWQEVDQRLVFFTVQLSTVESSIDATDKALKANGYLKIAQEAAAEEARRKNVAMDRMGGGPVRWQEFYGRTAEKFYYHPTSGATIHVNPSTPAQRPPQFDYIYRANEENRQKAEADAARIGSKIEDLLAYRRQLEAEQSVLWTKIAFRGASSQALSEKPLYRFDLTSPAAGATKPQIETIAAGATFLKAVDAELVSAQKAMDDQKAALDSLASATSAARADLQGKLLKLPAMAGPLADARDPIGQFAIAAKRLEDTAQNLVDAYKLSADAVAKDDLAAKRRYRGQIQEMSIDYASTVTTADRALVAAAAAWKVTPQAKATDPVVAKPPADADAISARLDAAKTTYATELAAAKRALVSAIDNRLNAAADAGDLGTVQTLQAAKVKAATDGTVDESIKDEGVLSAKRTMDQTVAASKTKLAGVYKETIVNLTKSRKITEAVAVQEELKASGLDAGGSTPAITTGGSTGVATPPAVGVGGGPAAPVIPGDVAQPAMTGETMTVKLAGPADNVVAGGGGRFLIFHLKKLRQLAVFDVNAAKVVKYINAPSDDIVYAASRDKLVIGIKETGSLQRWNLKTMTQEPSSQGIGPQIKTMAMGYDSAGPLIIVLAKASYIVNPEAPGKGEGILWDGEWDGAPSDVVVSADGHTVVSYGFPGWAGSRCIILSGTRIISRSSGGYMHYNDLLLPPDGGRIFDTMEAGKIFSPDYKSETKFEGLPSYGFPSYDPTYFVSWKGKGKDRKSTAKSKLMICTVSDRRPITTLTDLPELEGTAPVKDFQRVHFIPKANLLVTLGEGGDELVLRKLDVYKELENQGISYLVVTSAPPYAVVKGRALSYQMTVKSLKGNVKFSLDSGPTGMVVSPQGLLKWTAPLRAASETESVIVKVTDDSKQEVFHTFKLTLADAPGTTPTPVPGRPKKPK